MKSLEMPSLRVNVQMWGGGSCHNVQMGEVVEMCKIVLQIKVTPPICTILNGGDDSKPIFNGRNAYAVIRRILIRVSLAAFNGLENPQALGPIPSIAFRGAA